VKAQALWLCPDPRQKRPDVVNSHLFAVLLTTRTRSVAGNPPVLNDL
jgi:hypothetical protein